MAGSETEAVSFSVWALTVVWQICVQKSSRLRVGAGNFGLHSHSQQREQQRRRGVVVRASEVAVKEESGTPSLGLEVVETLEPICRVIPVSTLLAGVGEAICIDVVVWVLD